MGGEAWSLIGLKHPIGEAVLSCQVEIRLHSASRVVDKFKLRICGYNAAWGLADAHQVRAVHFPTVIFRHKSAVRMAQVVAIRKRCRGEGNFLAGGINSERSDIDAGLEGRVTAEEIIG